MTKEDIVFIKVNFRQDDYSPELIESIVALPSVVEADQMYPDDPALYNIVLVKVDSEEAQSILEKMSNYEFVDFAEIIDEPEIRGKIY